MGPTREVRTGVGFEKKAAVEALEQRRLLSVSLPRDVNAVGASVPTGNLTDVNGTLFFTTDDGASGVELWKTDGTEPGTVLVKDVRPGSSASTPANLLNLGGTLLLTANDGASGVELWRSDGTAAGTTLVKDIFAGASSSTPFGLVRFGGVAYFFAMAGSGASGNSVELWKTDGTAGGTTKVADVTGPAGYSAAAPVAAGGLLYFTYGNASAAQLWVSDGTAAGTQPLKTFTTGTNKSVSHLTQFNGRLYFSAPDAEAGQELWKSDGTAGGTVRVADIEPGPNGSLVSDLRVSGDKLFFQAGSTATGLELCTCDTADNVSIINITAGNQSSFMSAFTPLNGKLYFNNAGPNGPELWVSDGTSGGTREVVDLWAGPLPGAPANITAANGRLYFFARSSTAASVGLWTSTGEVGNATFLKRFSNVAANRPQGFTASGDKVFFTGNHGTTGIEVWVTDGTPTGTVLPRNVYPVTGSADPRYIGTLGDSLYYFANTGSGYQVWKSNGTAEGTVALSAPGSNIIGQFHDPQGHVANGYLYFTTSIDRPAPQGDHQLWRTDGTEFGTVELHSHFRPINSWSDAGGVVYFTRDSFNEVWKTNGTVAGTGLAHAFNGPVYLGPSVNGVAYAEGITTAHGQEVWRSNGPSAPFVRVTDVAPGAGDAQINGMTAVGNTLFFFAEDGVTPGNKLFKTDGTPGNWTLVKDIVPNNDDYFNADGIGATAARLFFNGGGSLWTSDGTPDGTFMVKDAQGHSPSQPSYITPLNDTEVVFEGDSRLWKSDGTAAGTVKLGEVDPEHTGTPWRSPFARLGNAVYLTNEAQGRPESLWRTDGTPQGTYMASNLDPGGRSTVGQLAAVNGSVLFTADDGVRGVEVWRYVPDPPLLVTEAQFDHAGAAPASHRLTFRLSAAAAAATQPVELSLMNLTTNTTVPAENFVRSYDAAARTVTFTFPGYPGGVLPNGNYRAVLPAGALADAAGNALGLDHTVEFYVLTGDVNRDRMVNGSDFALLAANFGRTGMTYGQGDLNGDGAVNGSDFALLAGNFGQTLPAPPAPAAAPVPTAPLAAAPAAGVSTVATPAPRPVRPKQPAPKPARRVVAQPAAIPVTRRNAPRRAV